MSDNTAPPQLPYDILHLVAVQLRRQDAGRTLISLARACRGVKAVVQPLIDRRLAITCKTAHSDRLKALLSNLTPAAPDAGPVPGKKARHPRRARERAVAKLSRLQKFRELCFLTCPTPTHLAHVRRLVKILQISTIFSNVQHLEISAATLDILHVHDELTSPYKSNLFRLSNPLSICFQVPAPSYYDHIPCIRDITKASSAVKRLCVHLDRSHRYGEIIAELVPLHIPLLELVDMSMELPGAAYKARDILNRLESLSQLRVDSPVRLRLSFPNVASGSLPSLLQTGLASPTLSPMTKQQAAMDDALALLAGNPDVDDVALYNLKIAVGKQARCSRGSVGRLCPRLELLLTLPSLVDDGLPRHREHCEPCPRADRLFQQCLSALLVGSVDGRQDRH
jgi:hypothetical protein